MAYKTCVIRHIKMSTGMQTEIIREGQFTSQYLELHVM